MQVFAMAPGDVKGLWVLGVVVALVLAIAGSVVVATIIGARTARFEVSAEGLRLRGDLYGRLISANELRPDLATRVDFAHRPELTPKRRTMGLKADTTIT